MSKNTKVWNVPEGYEIDKEQSNESKIVLKKIEIERVSSWKEYCEKMRGKSSYYFIVDFDEIRSSKFGRIPVLSEFEKRKDTEAIAAFCKLMMLRKDWIENWEPDWTKNEEVKFAICAAENRIVTGTCYCTSRPLSFPTEEMRDNFLDTFIDLLEQAKPLL